MEMIQNDVAISSHWTSITHEHLGRDEEPSSHIESENDAGIDGFRFTAL